MILQLGWRVCALVGLIMLVGLSPRRELRGEDGAASRPSGSSAAAASPEEFLGRPVGTDFELADWDQVRGFYRQLAESSPRVELRTVGKTTEGRDFLVAVISAEENLSRLEEIKTHAKTLADPRGKSPHELEQAVDEGKVILFVTPTMHSTEVAATEMGMQFAWELATSEEQPWKGARENVVVVITPSLNPDGVDHVVHWYREHVGTSLEGTALDRLYQFYTGHDNNRDWFMLTQAETRHLTRLLYHEWFPQVLWDVHQQGNTTERFFVPPYRDPLNPNLDPGIVAGINLIGTRAVMDMTRDGLSGIATGVSYDHWWNGGNRSVPTRHNIIGILTEAASAKYASPIFQQQSSLRDPLGSDRYQPSNQFVRPWAGGWWRVSDIVEYELAFARSLLGSLAREPSYWLTNTMEAAQRNIDAGRAGGPRGWLITVDNRDLGATRRLVDVLLASGVELHVAKEPFEADGRTYETGTIVIWRDQPYGGYVKDLFELQDFPSGTTPYDVTGWTLPLLLGVRRAEISQAFTAETRIVDSPDEALAAFSGDPRVQELRAAEGEAAPEPSQSSESNEVARPLPWSASDSDTWTSVMGALQEGHSLRLLTEKPNAGIFVAGDSEQDEASPLVALEKMPRIGVYAPWSASMDEGWLRWVLDDFEIPFEVVRNETIRDGNLNELFDVLIMPSVSARGINDGRGPDGSPLPISGGLDPEGSLAIESFVRDGGKLVATGSSAGWAIDLFRLPLTDVTSGSDARGFSCPGSVLRGVVHAHAITSGLPSDVPLFFSGSSGWKPMSDGDRKSAGRVDSAIVSLLSYAPTRLLLSGYIAKPEVLEGSHGWVMAEHGEGRIHLFGFRPHYRAWSQASFHLLFRAVMLELR